MASNNDNTNASPAPGKTTANASFDRRLRKTLDDVDPFGTFASFGDVPFLFQNCIVDVKGFGEVSLPLRPESAEILKGLASKSHHENIHKCWQLEADSVQVLGTEWKATLNKILLDAAYGLGLSNESMEKMGIKANLSKVLLYECQKVGSGDGPSDVYHSSDVQQNGDVHRISDVCQTSEGGSKTCGQE